MGGPDLNNRRKQTGSPLHGLRDKLGQSRSRAGRKLLLQGFLWSCGAASAFYLLLGLLRYFVEVPMFGVVVVGTALLLGWLATLAGAWLGLPGIDDLARRADSHYELEELLSTAVEVERGSDTRPRSEIAEALLRKAESTSNLIDPRQLVSRRVGAPAQIAVVLIVLALSVQVLPAHLPPFYQTVVPNGTSELIPSDERDKLAANVRRVAHLLEQEAERQNDAYLQAVARTLETLERDIGGGGLERSAAAEELDRLTDHVKSAFGGKTGLTDVRSSLLAEFDSLAVALAGSRQVNDATDKRRLTGGSNESDNDTAAPTSDDATANVDGEGGPGRDEPSGWSEEQQTPLALSDPKIREGELLEQAVLGYPELAPRSEREENVLTRLRQQRSAGQAIGAAQDAQRGASALAGEGVQPLGTDGDNPDTLREPGKDFLLPVQDRGAGRRIRVEISPKAMLSEVSESLPGTEGNWSRAREAIVRRENIDWDHRQAVNRYFTSLPNEDPVEQPTAGGDEQ